jgi:hypothetical protein
MLSNGSSKNIPLRRSAFDILLEPVEIVVLNSGSVDIYYIIYTLFFFLFLLLNIAPCILPMRERAEFNHFLEIAVQDFLKQSNMVEFKPLKTAGPGLQTKKNSERTMFS